MSHIHTIIFMCADMNHSLRYESKALCEAMTQIREKELPWVGPEPITLYSLCRVLYTT